MQKEFNIQNIISDLENFRNIYIDSPGSQLVISELNSTQRSQVHAHCSRLGLCSTSSDILPNGLKNIIITKNFKANMDLPPTDLDIELSNEFEIPLWYANRITSKVIKT